MTGVSEFFEGKSVFITGATGFVGVVLVEKLLKSCESVKNIYVLIRNKKNENSQQRYDKLVKHAAFESIRKRFPERLLKLKVVNGDVSVGDLGISSDDKRELMENVRIVFHCAAVVRFDFSLMDAMKTNVIGTHRVLKLAEKMKHLESFVFVSTAFSQSYQKCLEERYYPTGFDVFSLLDHINSNDKRSVDEAEKKLFQKGHPSTYTMSKAFAEELVFRYGYKLPVTIVRPSIIVGSLEDPEPGYVQGFQSTTGLLAGSALGVFRVALLSKNVTVQMVPVDYTVNCIIAAASKRLFNLHSTCAFFNCTNSPTNQITWGDIGDHVKNNCSKFVPYEKLLYYPRVFVTQSYFLYTLAFVFKQFIPGILFDLVLLLTGKKPFMIKLQKNIFKMMMDFSYFSKINYTIDIQKMQKLFQEMKKSDQKVFNFDMETIDWYVQVEKNLIGIRKFMFKENESTVGKAKAKLKRLWIVDMIFKTLIILGILNLFFNLAD